MDWEEFPCRGGMVGIYAVNRKFGFCVFLTVFDGEYMGVAAFVGVCVGFWGRMGFAASKPNV